MSILTKIFGDPNKKRLATFQSAVDHINDLEKKIAQYSDEDIRKEIDAMRDRVHDHQTALEKELPECFALVREVAKRTLNQRHFDVQLIGGMVLHQGNIAEMKTGEGKTLTSTLPVVLNALTGKGAHVVTVNDYLSKRDADWMGRIYHRLGLSVGCIQHDQAFLYDPQSQEISDSSASFKVDMQNLRPVSRREAYMADITYGTNNEFGFDYLRDHMVSAITEKVQRDLHFAIVDEVDSILIDEARTPLIISAPDEEATDKYRQIYHLVEQLQEKSDYNVDEKMKAATLTEDGIRKMEQFLGVENIYEERGIREVHLIEQALKARALFRLDRDYVIKDGEIIIVDEFTGRLMFGRRYSEGLHQAIEAKEAVEIRQESRTLATITFQNYFRLYKKLSGMTGTAATEAEEFSKIYHLDVIQIPTHKQMIRDDRPDVVYKTEKAKLEAVVKKIIELQKIGQPVLVGTISIEKNELLGQLLLREAVPHHLLNAKNHEKEAEIIAQAGKSKAVTVATNMAGRGVDIILGGNPQDPQDGKFVRSLGGLAVIGTERHEARRIDNQLRGRSGRQGDPGASQFFVSLEDDLMRIFGSEKMKRIMNTMGIADDIPIENKLFSRAIESSQKKVEGLHFDTRKHIVEYDDVMNKHREVIYQKRDEILKIAHENPNELRQKILEMVEAEIEHVVSFHTAMEGNGDWNIKEIIETMETIFPLHSSPISSMNEKISSPEGKKQDVELRSMMIQTFIDESKKAYDQFAGGIGDEQVVHQIEKGIMLRAIDTLWVNHLDQMTYLREGIGLRGYAQQDPLVEYKREAYQQFIELNDSIQRQIVYSIYKIGYAHSVGPNLFDEKKAMSAKSNNSPAQGLRAFQPSKKNQSGEKIGRNDPCFCGSGKKYKKCHGQ